MLLAEFDEEAFVRDIREEGKAEGRAEGKAEGRAEGLAEGLTKGLEEGLEKGLKSLIAALQKFVSSPQELYQMIISNEDYSELTFEEVQKIIRTINI